MNKIIKLYMIKNKNFSKKIIVSLLIKQNMKNKLFKINKMKNF